MFLLHFGIQLGGAVGGKQRQQRGKQAARSGIGHDKAVVFPAFCADKLARYGRTQRVGLYEADALRQLLDRQQAGLGGIARSVGLLKLEPQTRLLKRRQGLRMGQRGGKGAGTEGQRGKG